MGRSFRAHQNCSWNRKSTSAQASATQSGCAVRRILKTVMAPNRTLVMDKPRIIESTVARIWKFSTTAPCLTSLSPAACFTPQPAKSRLMTLVIDYATPQVRFSPNRAAASGRKRSLNAHSQAIAPRIQIAPRPSRRSYSIGKPTRSGAMRHELPPPACSGTTGRGAAHPTPSAGTTGWHSPRRSRSHWTAHVPSAIAGLRREPGRGPRRRCRAFPG